MIKFKRYQQSWMIKIGKLTISCYRRYRAARWHYEVRREDGYIQFGWASPVVHRWWARTFYIYWR